MVSKIVRCFSVHWSKSTFSHFLRFLCWGSSSNMLLVDTSLFELKILVLVCFLCCSYCYRFSIDFGQNYVFALAMLLCLHIITYLIHIVILKIFMFFLWYFSNTQPRHFQQISKSSLFYFTLQSTINWRQHLNQETDNNSVFVPSFNWYKNAKVLEMDLNCLKSRLGRISIQTAPLHYT